jgi:protease PrsW
LKLRLVVQNGELAGNQFELQTGFLQLGRGTDASVRFDDRLVSTYHAIIQSDPNGYYIADQGSTNGTFINGSKVENTWLKTGDVIELGNEGPRLKAILEEVTTTVDLPAAAVTLPPKTIGDKITGAIVYDPQKDRPKAAPPAVSKRAGIAIALVLTGILTLLVMGIMVYSIGPVGALVGAIMAFTPAPFYLTIFVYLDRYDPEPPWALAGIFAWGGLVAIFISFLINTAFGSVAAALIDPQTGDTLSAVISAPLIEEATKGLGVVLVLIFLRREFDGILDGIVYAGIVGLGFATVENVMYYGQTFRESGGAGLLFIVFLRGVLSPFIHSFFTSMTGIGCGIARETQKKQMKIIMPFVGYLGAVTLHGCWNLIASLSGMLFFVVYFLIWVPLFLVFLTVVFFIARRERKILRDMLSIEVATGLLSQQQLDLISSFFDRTKWVLAVLSDRQRFSARRKFLRSAAKLGYCYWHVARANAVGMQTISLPQIPRFKTEVATLQKQI